MEPTKALTHTWTHTEFYGNEERNWKSFQGIEVHPAFLEMKRAASQCKPLFVHPKTHNIIFTFIIIKHYYTYFQIKPQVDNRSHISQGFNINN